MIKKYMLTIIKITNLWSLCDFSVVASLINFQNIKNTFDSYKYLLNSITNNILKTQHIKETKFK